MAFSRRRERSRPPGRPSTKPSRPFASAPTRPSSLLQDCQEVEQSSAGPLVVSEAGANRSGPRVHHRDGEAHGTTRRAATIRSARQGGGVAGRHPAHAPAHRRELAPGRRDVHQGRAATPGALVTCHARSGRRRLLHLAATAPFTALALQALAALDQLTLRPPTPAWP
jgi:hypothetical protein